MRVVAAFPFAGSPLLLTARPSAYLIGGLDAGVRVTAQRGNAGIVHVTATGRSIDPERLAAHLKRVKRNVDRCIGFARADLATWERELSDRLQYEVGERAAFLAGLAEFEAQLAAE